MAHVPFGTGGASVGAGVGGGAGVGAGVGAALRGTTVRVRAGAKVAVVGRTGAGKSSVAAALLRL